MLNSVLVLSCGGGRWRIESSWGGCKVGSGIPVACHPARTAAHAAARVRIQAPPVVHSEQSDGMAIPMHTQMRTCTTALATDTGAASLDTLPLSPVRMDCIEV